MTKSTRARSRTWKQRLTITFVVLAAVAAFGAAAGLAAGQWVLAQRNLVVIDGVATAEPVTTSPIVYPGATTTIPVAHDAAGNPVVNDDEVVLAEPEAANFLITGADSNACLDPGSPYAGGIGNRSALGERSDTIMVWRVNPSTNNVAVLSFPRDLYVTVNGGGKARINSAYRQDDPQRLIDTLYLNFQVPIDHYVQVDFCAFKRLVDAIGGVDVPFEFPARDKNTKLDISQTGCVNLDGETALAYVRSRKYEYEDPAGSGNWRRDGTSDFGRISRQQDFIRRVISGVISKGLYTPSVATALIDTNSEYLVTDTGLTLTKMLEFAGTLQGLDPALITTFQVETHSANRSGQSVEIPSINGDNMQAILSVFRGEATIASAPDQVFASTTTAAPRQAGSTGSSTTSPGEDDRDGTGDVVDTTKPAVVLENNNVGVAPDPNATC